jgi:hypothetical protein
MPEVKLDESIENDKPAKRKVSIFVWVIAVFSGICSFCGCVSVLFIMASNSPNTNPRSAAPLPTSVPLPSVTYVIRGSCNRFSATYSDESGNIREYKPSPDSFSSFNYEFDAVSGQELFLSARCNDVPINIFDSGYTINCVIRIDEEEYRVMEEGKNPVATCVQIVP